MKDIEGDSDPALNDVLKKYKDEKQFCTPDGIFKKSEKFYIWEAKNWPNWEEKRKGKKPLDQLRDVLFSLPFILAARADYQTKIYNIDGILFSWWSKPEGLKPEELESLLRDVSALIAPRTFELFYTADVLEDCITNQYPWYLEIIKGERARIDTLFKDLLGQANPEIDRKLENHPRT